MIITEKGKYKVLRDFATRSTVSIGTIAKDSILEITQIDDIGNKVIGPDLFDWMPNDLPLEKVR